MFVEPKTWSIWLWGVLGGKANPKSRKTAVWESTEFRGLGAFLHEAVPKGPSPSIPEAREDMQACWDAAFPGCLQSRPLSQHQPSEPRNLDGVAHISSRCLRKHLLRACPGGGTGFGPLVLPQLRRATLLPAGPRFTLWAVWFSVSTSWACLPRIHHLPRSVTEDCAVPAPQGGDSPPEKGAEGQSQCRGGTEGPWSKAGGSGGQPEPRQEDPRPAYHGC